MASEHTTHHDDCGCLSERFKAELAAERAHADMLAELMWQVSTVGASNKAVREALAAHDTRRKP